MSVNLNVFENILNRYKFRQPVPVSVQDYILANREAILRDTLKKLNRYSFFYGMALTVYFFLKKTGLGVSILASKAITAAVVIIVSASVSFGMYTVARHYILPRLLDEKSAPVEVSSPGASIATVDPVSSNRQQAVTRYALGIGRFSSSSVDRDTLRKVEDIIISELIKIKGTAVTDIRNESTNRSLKYILSGSIETLGRQQVLSVKVISVDNSKILFAADETVDRPSGLEKACRSIVGKIAPKI